MRSTAPSAASASSATDARLPRPAAGAIRSRLLFGVACAAVSLAGCGTLPRNAVPPELVGEARVANLPDVRAWAGRQSAAAEEGEALFRATLSDCTAEIGLCDNAADVLQFQGRDG